MARSEIRTCNLKATSLTIKPLDYKTIVLHLHCYLTWTFELGITTRHFTDDNMHCSSLCAAERQLALISWHLAWHSVGVCLDRKRLWSAQGSQVNRWNDWCLLLLQLTRHSSSSSLSSSQLSVDIFIVRRWCRLAIQWLWDHSYSLSIRYDITLCHYYYNYSANCLTVYHIVCQNNEELVNEMRAQVALSDFTHYQEDNAI